MTKIALVQQAAAEDRSSNISKGLAAVRSAAANGANIICFAELAFDRFYPQVPATDESLQAAETIPGPITEQFSALAAELGVVLVLNLFERDGELTYDSSPIIDSDGTLLGVTRMIHITDYPCFHEKGYYAPGNLGVQVHETEFGRIGVAICYDRHYPEYMRALAVREAEIVFVPQAGAIDEWPEGLYEAEMRVASFQNGFFTALCNRVGQEEHLTFAGESFVCDPQGTVIARAGKLSDEILTCDLDRQQVIDSHARRLFLRDRRPEIYADWIQQGHPQT